MEGKYVNTITPIRYDLKGERLEQRSTELSELIKKKVLLEVEKSEYNKIKGAEIKAVQEMIEKIAENLSNGFEIIDTSCKKRKNYALSVWEFISNETGEIFKTLPFDDDDYQTSIEDYDDEY
ncbi:MAG: hypothetical protein GX963_09075 [Bacteroidales bacterium]|nr:hypothetical protein [Bacteroidales bacterium]